MVQTGDNMMALKRGNRAAVLLALQTQGAMSRKRLAAQVHLTPAAITKIVAELIGEGLVREGDSLPAPGAGRREVCIMPVPESRCALGLLIDRGQAILSATRLDGRRVFSEMVALDPAERAEDAVRGLCRRLLELARDIPAEKRIGVGVAVRGHTDAAGRVSVNSMGALSAGTHPVADWVEQETGLRAHMMNNVRAMMAAQMLLSRVPLDSTQFFLRCEYGIGAALASGGEIRQGSSNRCSELGHIPVVRGGKICTCGKRGCLETVASPMAICEDARALLSPEDTPLLWQLVGKRQVESVPLDSVLMAAAYGDSGVAALIDRAVEYLAQALRAVVYIVDPEQIMLYGRVFESDYFVTRLVAEMREGVDADRTIRVERSPWQGQLEHLAAPLVAVHAFFRAGGMNV